MCFAPLAFGKTTSRIGFSESVTCANQGANLLSLEGEVGRDGQQRGEAVETIGRREPEAEAGSGGADAG